MQILEIMKRKWQRSKNSEKSHKKTRGQTKGQHKCHWKNNGRNFEKKAGGKIPPTENPSII